MTASAVPLLDPSWWQRHALAGMPVEPSATWCWFNARHWLPEVDPSSGSVPAVDTARLLRQAALLLEATHRGGVARQWLSAADLVWARRTGLAMLGTTRTPRLSMRDALHFFDEAEQMALRLALPHGLVDRPSIAVEAPVERRMRRLLAACRHYNASCTSIR